MSEINNAKELIAAFLTELTEERLAEARRHSGIGYLPPGALAELVKDQPFSAEDIVTILHCGMVLQRKDNQINAARVTELEDICSRQQKSIDDIADQAMRLRSLFGSVLPDRNPASPLEMLKEVAACAGNNGSSKP